ncbi:ABC transporter ATP-binding protein [Cryobacterium sp. M15]|uniref:ABC transporter ATP-binding protein n=1 Tax=Cryobacterium sp. M15 TaxID=2048291 RepID=UPI000CE4BC2A|nr:ABC transporter ATP-binding protein [Cryobacterium sp. M15]
MSILEISELVVARGAGIVLQGLTVEVANNEIAAILGPNGAGKTTLLETIVGLHRPQSGHVVFDGDDITGAKPHQIAARGIRLVPEGRRLFSGLTVGENLRIGAEGAGLKEWRWVLEIFPQLQKLLGSRGGTLSGGEQQMVAIGRALVAKPRLMILDEPSWGLAPLLVDDVLTAVENIRQLGTTIVLVEQNVEAALKIAGQAHILADGKIQRSLGHDEAIARPEFLREAYLGAPIAPA